MDLRRKIYCGMQTSYEYMTVLWTTLTAQNPTERYKWYTSYVNPSFNDVSIPDPFVVSVKSKAKQPLTEEFIE